MFFSKKTSKAENRGNFERPKEFAYLDLQACYLDSACQTQRLQSVLTAEAEYFAQYNACGGRVKYEWGQKVDTAVASARNNILKLAGKCAKEYCVAFTLNTSYGINLVLQQLPAKQFSGIVTSEIEHNSVLLPSITWAKKANVRHSVLPRSEHGELQFVATDMAKKVVLVNTVSNIDGRTLTNVQEVTRITQEQGGIVLLDAAQTFAHHPSQLRTIEFDAAFSSGHKMYGPSIGFIIIKKDLLRRLDYFFIGGGTVSDVTEDDYALLNTDEEPYAPLEVGLQNWGGIIGLGKAVEWLLANQSLHVTEQELAARIFTTLQGFKRVHLINPTPSPIISFYVDGIDSHRLALYLSQKNIMCRSGYFCCHSYLKNKRNLPPLVRISLGAQNTQSDIDTFTAALSTILTTL